MGKALPGLLAYRLRSSPRRFAIATLACCAAAWWAATWCAAAAAAERAPISLRDAAAIVQQAYGGRVVSASQGVRRTAAGAERGYWIRVDIRGRIKTVFVDIRGRIHEDAKRDLDAGCGLGPPCACC